MRPYEDLSREELMKLIEVYAKNWLAHDGCWFLSIEHKHGLEMAMELDADSWYRFAAMEARRIMEAFEIPAGGGLRALEKALNYRLYAAINRQSVEWIDSSTFRFKMLECRVQQARKRKGLAEFPCKEVGKVEFSRFAEAVDPRIQTKCISCPPDPVGEYYCGWEFSLNE